MESLSGVVRHFVTATIIDLLSAQMEMGGSSETSYENGGGIGRQRGKIQSATNFVRFITIHARLDWALASIQCSSKGLLVDSGDDNAVGLWSQVLKSRNHGARSARLSPPA